ncbi:hypothetical protein DS745_14795 [Anaerobacillus alkaliphilus]|uniref:Competence protein ComG n=1 Tax=Anaerobacillus alkaliphilus TaxID=1548597 RepID=A0A4Q0VTT2_9BACI|nr:competence type IV pilus minor pilin ComGG [Anaerobacillus alkaliphilus]RXI99484.1 hypothetical protein DS745_14795 [Anaerobacillus alkaliphilus]
MDNNRGFILPTTLMILFLLLSFLTFQISQYMIEKELIKEEAELFTAERLLQKGIVDVSKMLKSDSRDVYSGILFYEEGEITFVVKKEVSTVKSVQVVSKTYQNRSKQTTFYYNIQNETVLPWLKER